MKFYREITLIDQAEISPYFIWSKLYTQLHIALVEVKDQNNQVKIGLSFPQYIFEKELNKKAKVNLGKKLRLFSQTEEDLNALNLRQWLDRLMDYAHITSIREVPQDKITGYAYFSRKQIKSNPERLARRRAIRGGMNLDEALKQYQNIGSSTDLPYIQMKSLTSGKSFKLFIEKHNAEKSENQVYSTYGLSSESCTPEF